MLFNLEYLAHIKQVKLVKILKKEPLRLQVQFPKKIKHQKRVFKWNILQQESPFCSRVESARLPITVLYHKTQTGMAEKDSASTPDRKCVVSLAAQAGTLSKKTDKSVAACSLP